MEFRKTTRRLRLTMALPRPLTNAQNILRRLPGIGPKQALRIGLFLLRQGELREALAETLIRLGKETALCKDCFRIIEQGMERCDQCISHSRDNSQLAIVEEDIDLEQIEKTGAYSGNYFVLGGRFSPRGGDPQRQGLRLPELKQRLEQGRTTLKEAVIATNPTAEGDALALYLIRELKPFGITITRLGRGLPLGGEIEYADEETLKGAIEHRT